jgi:hypothetical protein
MESSAPRGLATARLCWSMAPYAGGSPEAAEFELTLLGFIAMHDPPCLGVR